MMLRYGREQSGKVFRRVTRAALRFKNRNNLVSQVLVGLAQRPILATGARYLMTHGPTWVREAAARQERKHRRLAYAMVPAKRLRATYRRGLNHLVEKVGRDGIGDYLEFGVHSGSSLLCMYRELQTRGLRHVRLFGFDSFEGLPVSTEPDDAGWVPGAYRSEYEFALQILKDERVEPARVLLTRGWFSDTLTPELSIRNNLSKASVIMVDCDQYLGAKQALTFCAPLIKDHAFILFDDWNSGNLAARGLGQKRAFGEFLSSGEFTVKQCESYTGNAAVFFVSRCRMCHEVVYGECPHDEHECHGAADQGDEVFG
jgi:O-methyltransferase